MAKWYKYGRYYLLRHIATGGMAEIFLSKQLGLEGFEKLLVIKKILNQYAENQDFITMFLDEARLAAKLDHPNIVRIYDLGKQGNSYYIAMEYIAGEDLRGIMKKISQKGQLIPIQHTIHIISSISEGLDYAHKKKDPSGKPLNIIHRDISPQNVMVSYEGNVKLLDFGIAKASTQSSETEAGVLKGKYAYMSPEQAKGKKLDHRSDIFSVGILLFEMLTNHRLFKAGNQLDTLRKLVYEEIPSPKSFNPNIPDRLEEIVMKALEKDPDKRYHTARDFQADLEEFVAESQLICSPTRTAKFMQEIFVEELKNLQTLEQKIEDEQKDVVSSDLPDISQDTGLFESGTGFNSFHVRQHTNISSWNKTGITGTNASNASSQSGIFSAQASIPTTSSSKIVIILLVLLLVLGGIAVFAFISMNKKKTEDIKEIVMEGRLSLNTNPTGATILINGKEYKEKTPTIIEKLPINKPIAIKIQKEGYADVVKDVTIDSADQLHQESIELKVEQATVKYGLVRVTSNPEGAVIYIDNKKTDKKTNVTLQEVIVGEHNVFLELNGYDAHFEKFKVSENELTEISATLYKEGTVRHGFLTVNLKTEGADVLLNGEVLSFPAENIKVEPDKEFTITAKKSGYESFSITKKLKIGEKESVDIELQKKRVVVNTPQSGTLNVTTNVKGATIFVNGKKQGTDKISDLSLKAGTYTVSIKSKSLMLNYSKTVRVSSGKTTTEELNPGKGKIAISVKPWANVFINDKKIGTTPIAPQTVFEGEYSIRLENPKGSPITKTVSVKDGETKLIMESFN
ncbi:serine/threonine protein kinase [bacterium]|nr:serine/threonine protein kinase [bacterium]